MTEVNNINTANIFFDPNLALSNIRSNSTMFVELNFIVMQTTLEPFVITYNACFINDSPVPYSVCHLMA